MDKYVAVAARVYPLCGMHSLLLVCWPAWNKAEAARGSTKRHSREG